MQPTRARQGLERNQPTSSAADGFARLAMDLHNAPDLRETVARVLRFARQAVSCEVTSVLLRDRATRRQLSEYGDGYVTVHASSLDSVDGPWLALGPRRHSILIQDTARDTRWPRWRQGMTKLGLRSTLSTRLATGQVEMGALNFYSATPGGLAAADCEVASVLASYAAIAIESAQATEDLALAVEARTIVGQAQGLLMAQFGLTSTQAFALLRRYSQDSNTRLLTVARQFVETRQLPELRPAPDIERRNHWRTKRSRYDSGDLGDNQAVAEAVTDAGFDGG